jgi:hypothetical protein
MTLLLTECPWADARTMATPAQILPSKALELTLSSPFVDDALTFGVTAQVTEYALVGFFNWKK